MQTLGKRVFADVIEGLDLGRLSSITVALMIGSSVRTEDVVITEAEAETTGEGNHRARNTGSLQKLQKTRRRILPRTFSKNAVLQES